MKKLLLSLVLSSSMLHYSSAFADTSNDELNGDEQPSMIMAPPPAVFEAAAAFAAHSNEEEQPSVLMAPPPAVFEAAAASHPSAKLFNRHGMDLIPVGPEEGIVLGKPYYSISFSEESPFEPVSLEIYQLLCNYYIDAYVHFEPILGSPDKRKATLTVRENTEHERSINLFLSVITPHS